MGLRLRWGLRVTLGEAVEEREGRGLPEGTAVVEGQLLTLCVGLLLALPVAQGLLVSVEEGLRVPGCAVALAPVGGEGVAEGVGVRLLPPPPPLPVAQAEGLREAEAEPESVPTPALALLPAEAVVAFQGVGVREGLAEGSGEALALSVPVRGVLPEGQLEGLGEGLPLPPPPPPLTEGVKDTLPLTVPEALPPPPPPAAPKEGLCCPDTEGEPLPLLLLEGLLEAEGERVTLAGEAEGVREAEGQGLGEPLPLGLPLCLELRLGL